MNRSSNRMALTLALVSFAGVASAKDIFVSTDPNWKMPGLEGNTYTTLQDAVAKVAAGDTVWLQDGFVCESGQTGSISGYGYARVKLPLVAFTLRSASGYVDEAAGKGAYIRGAKDPASTYDDGRGTGAIRPVWSQHAGTILQGLVLENGSTGDHFNYGSGGAIYGPATVTNCILRNVSAYCGGGLGSSNCRAYNTVISNCYAFGTGYGGGAVMGGGSLYNCLIAGNSAVKIGGAVYYNNNSGTDYQTVYSNCVFKGNFAQDTAAIRLNKSDANTKRVRIVDCQIVGNYSTDGGNGGIVGAATLERCTVAGNRVNRISASRAQSNNGGVGATDPSAPPATWPVLVDCVVSNNYAVNEGGGLYYGYATNCLFVGNWSCGNGGGATHSVLSHCRFVGNCASNVVVASNSPDGNGGGCSDSTAYDCEFVGNWAWAQNLVGSGNGGAAANSDLYNCVISNNWAAYRGAAVYNPGGSGTPRVCCNCLIVGNVSAAPHVGYDRGMIIEGESSNTMPANPPEFYNCTIADNVTPAYAAINAAKLFNCIVWGNSAPDGEFFPNQVTAKYTCQKGLTAGVDGNVNADPKFAVGYVPRRTSPCVDAAETYGWMTAPGDVRASDLVGNPRILGAGPDMGCYEYASPKGLRIILE